ncbi:MAG TPA: hypothetical protein VF382_01100 [Actinomycetota bacterium]|jgi:hypothetical protein
MPNKNGRKSLVREGEPSQKTKTGLEIPVPKTEDFNRLLSKAATKRSKKDR